MVPGCALAFVASWVFATSNMLTRKIKEINWTVVLFWHNSVGFISVFIGFLVYCLIAGQPFLSYTDKKQWFIMIGGGVGDFIGLATVIQAFQNAPVGFVGLLMMV